MNWKSVVAGTVLIGSSALAQESADSVVYRLPEVVVTATRSQISIEDSPSPVEVINVMNAPALQGVTVADLLQTTNGVFLQDLGANAALKTAFLRGTAPQHLLVLVNGTRFNSLQNGLVDMSLLSLNDIDRIEVVRGGSSALYGADALGGVVNILTRQARPGTRIRAQGGGGSYGYRRWLVEGEGGYGEAGLLAGLSREEGTDDYPFVRSTPGQPDQSARRRNSDFSKFHGYINGSVPVSRQSDVQVASQFIRVKRGVPGSLSFPSDAARQDDENINLNVGFRNNGLKNLEFRLRSSFSYSLQTYTDPNPAFPIDVTYRNTLVMINPQTQILLGSAFRTLLGAELGSGRLNGNDFDGAIKRTQQSVYLSQEASWSFQTDWFDKVSLYGMVRYDDISDVGTAVMPKLGFNVRLAEQGDFRIRGSYGSSFRAPSFNDLYFRGFNNPGLKAERSRSLDVGILSTIPFQGSHSFELTYFMIDTKDRILFDLVSFKPVNIGRTKSEGWETKYSGAFLEEKILIGLAFTLTDARKRHRSSTSDPTFDKQLQFIPKHTAHAKVTLSLEPLSVSLTQSFVGRRYVNEENTASLPQYTLTGLGVGSRFSAAAVCLTVKAEILNLFDRRYQVFPDYPMPGRTVRFTGGIEY